MSGRRELSPAAKLMRLTNTLAEAYRAGVRALNAHVLERQRVQAIEECAELIVALKHEDRGKVSEDDVREEIADVLMCGLQLVLMYGVDECTDALASKTTRLHERLGRRLEEGNA